MNLYEIDLEINKILEQVNEDGELPEDAIEQLEKLAMDEKTKLENTAVYYKNLLSDTKSLREEEKALAERRKAKEKNAERVKTYLSDYLQAKGMKKYETTRAVLSFRKSVKTEIDEAVLPDIEKYWVVTKKPDTAWIKTLLKDGVEVPGASLVENQNIQIK